MIKKFNNFINESMENNKWKDDFKRQLGNGKYWKKLLGDDFEKRQFLDRSDAVYICKMARAEAFTQVRNSLDPVKDKLTIDSINKMIVELWDQDDSALGYVIPKEEPFPKKSR